MKRRAAGPPEDAPLRSKRLKRVDISQVRRFFAGPSYAGMSDFRAGGRCSTATLGPNSLTGMGSDSNPSKPPGIIAARKQYPKKIFVAGHLLNADFGGHGDDSKNLTILTSEGNSQHKKFDQPVRDALGKLAKLYELLSLAYVDVAALRYGIEVSVSVSAATWGNKPPDSFICQSLLCTAATENEPDLNQLANVAGDPLDDRTQRSAQILIDEIDHLVAKANQAGVVANRK